MASDIRCRRTCKCRTRCRWWTTPQIDEVRRLAAERLSAGRIARFIGRTRQQVCGLCRRMGIDLVGKGGAPFGNHNAQRHGRPAGASR